MPSSTTLRRGCVRCWPADEEWQVPDPDVRQAAGPAWDAPVLDARVRPLLQHRVRLEVEPFLRTMRRRLDRDRNRIHEYHNDLHLVAQKKLAALAGSAGEKAESDRKREMLRIAAIEREYAAKLGDLRHNYALRVTVEWVQGLELFVPVQRFEVLVKRRKGERLMRLDWHPAVRLMEPPPSDWGLGIGRSRLVCDDQLHITDPAGQSPCPSCGQSVVPRLPPDGLPALRARDHKLRLAKLVKFVFDRVCCLSMRSFLVRNWCGGTNDRDGDVHVPRCISRPAMYIELDRGCEDALISTCERRRVTPIAEATRHSRQVWIFPSRFRRSASPICGQKIGTVDEPIGRSASASLPRRELGQRVLKVFSGAAPLIAPTMCQTVCRTAIRPVGK